MRSPQTLRGRLTLAYASSLVLALIVFAALALAVIDRSQRRALDAQLASIAHATRQLVEPSDYVHSLDLSDRTERATIPRAVVNSAILRPNGSVTSSSTSAIPAEIRVDATRATSPTYATLANRRDAIRAYVVPVFERGVRLGSIAVWRDVEAIEELDKDIGIAFAIAIPLIAGIAIVAGSAIARRGLAPLADMAALASEIEAHDLTQRLGPSARDDELVRLAATLDRMLDRLQRAFDRERRFTGDASHELRAPLSVIRAEADLALRRDRDGGEYRRALQTIATEADALESLTRDLLAAARADDGAGARRETIELGAFVRTIAERFAVVAAARHVVLECRIETTAVVDADRNELERALVAIVDNAVKYAPGLVAIALSATARTVDICVVDDGAGFSAAALEHAFERFWRDDAARQLAGSGLGLGIARANVVRAGGTIELGNEPGAGARVRVRLPRLRTFEREPPVRRPASAPPTEMKKEA